MPASSLSPNPRAAVVGGGPAGLMAAEVLRARGVEVDVYDAMASVGRKFLLAGKGGLNLTHSEPFEPFLGRFAERAPQIEPLLRAFDGPALREWAAGLGIETFVGTSGRVFPADMKAAPLLRAWLHRLREAGVRFHMRRRWLGWTEDGALRFAGADGESTVKPDATVLALGGASWPQLGSDGSWVELLAARGVDIAALRPSNCGFDLARPWTAHFAERFAGQPIKPVALHFEGQGGRRKFDRRGEFVVTATGIEGSLIYAASALIREEIAEFGSATIHLDLLPDRDAAFVAAECARPRGSRSLSTHLKSRLGIEGLKAGLLHELLSKEQYHDTAVLAATLKRLPLTLAAARPVAEAISTAGGVRFEALDERLMLRALPGVFCAGEMLDWEAPTGGYLLTASMASGRAAGHGAGVFL
ncbi:TIGR03862 family flavoprotein [Paucibacter sp. R3-3]|uniref:TIGR03862 family flavoprotein n=1 Tax=Roseateles agri TaxID=3098619 RepID=A0ABU5DNV4_9BURK|nr:TIGR03862 family flavoprotein [Paucibacter sp. R3-3]MDY0747992.1 TIGR03862 family flavoprotein [Paucibacter sp. R3-3]